MNAKPFGGMLRNPIQEEQTRNFKHGCNNMNFMLQILHYIKLIHKVVDTVHVYISKLM